MTNIQMMPDMDKDQFISFLKLAMDKTSPEAKVLYAHLLKCFVDADLDLDGRITPDEFASLVDIAGVQPRKHGLAPTTEETFKGDIEAMKKVRLEHFRIMDHNHDGTISFDEFLNYTRDHIAGKLTTI